MDRVWLGFDVSGREIIVVGLTFNGDGTVKELVEEATWKLQTGDKPEAYSMMFDSICTYLTEKRINMVIIKDSSSTGGIRLSTAHLKSAELRGVVVAASAKVSKEVTVLSTGVVAKVFGERNRAEYLADDTFWNKVLNGVKLNKKSREAALLILTARKLQDKHDK